MSVYVPFEDQRKQDASFTIKAMGIQLGINVGTAIVVMVGFSLLRPVSVSSSKRERERERKLAYRLKLLVQRHTLVYAPKSKFATREYVSNMEMWTDQKHWHYYYHLNRHQPPVIESNGWLSWVKPILRIKDEQLLSLIGCDAVLYIRFVRLLRKMLFFMSILGIGALIPVYIVATKATGYILYVCDSTSTVILTTTKQ